MGRFTVSEFAYSDLEDLFRYLAEVNPDAAVRFVGDMMKRFDLVAHNPRMGVAKDSIIVGLRLFP